MQRIKLGRTSEDVTLDYAFEEFTLFNKSKNLSPRTLQYYEETFLLFQDFTKLIYCYQISQKTITDFIMYLFNVRQLKDVTVNSRLRNLAPYINFCIHRNYLNHKVEIQQVKENETIKELYTREEIEILLEKPDIKKCNFSEYRNWVIINYVLATRQ